MQKFLVFAVAITIGMFVFACSRGDPGPAGPDTAAVVFQNGISPSSAYAGGEVVSISSAFPDVDLGSCAGSILGYELIDGYEKARVLIKFDVSYIVPSNVHVVSAKIKIDVQVHNGNTVNAKAFKISSGWTKGTNCQAVSVNGATWNTKDGSAAWTAAGGDYDTASAETEVSINSSGTCEIPINIQVAESWIKNPVSNYGLILIASDEANVNNIALNPDSTQLIINYTLP